MRSRKLPRKRNRQSFILLQFILSSDTETVRDAQGRIAEIFSKFSAQLRFDDLRAMMIVPESEAKAIRTFIKRGEGLDCLYMVIIACGRKTEIIKGPAFDALRSRSGNIKLGGMHCIGEHEKLPIRRRFDRPNIFRK